MLKSQVTKLLMPDSLDCRRTKRTAPMRIVFVDADGLADFEPARQRLAADIDCGRCVVDYHADLVAAKQAIVDSTRRLSPPPDLLLLAQSRPHAIAAAQVASLRRLAPLATIVVILGDWCAGEERSGVPIAGVVRVPWHRFAPQWQRHLECWSEGQCSVWQLPSTSTDEERLLWNTQRTRANGSGLKKRNGDEQITVAIQRRSGKDDWLSAVCRAAGWRVIDGPTQRAPGTSQFALGVWQTDRLDPADLTPLRKMVRAVAPAPVIVIAGHLRPEHVEQVAAAGGSCVLATPLEVDEFLSEARRLIAANRTLTPG